MKTRILPPLFGLALLAGCAGVIGYTPYAAEEPYYGAPYYGEPYYGYYAESYPGFYGEGPLLGDFDDEGFGGFYEGGGFGDFDEDEGFGDFDEGDKD